MPLGNVSREVQEDTSVFSWRTYWRAPAFPPLYVDNVHSANSLILHYFPPQSPPPVVGFDLEWKPFYGAEPENPVALVQLAASHVILLLHISAMGSFPSALVALLADPRVVKTGVGIQGDINKLYQDWNIEIARNCVELSLLARSVDNDTWKGKYTNPIGLARLVKHYLKKRLQKGKITVSNWEAHPLDAMQIEYAANDAHAGYLLYVRLIGRLSKFPCTVQENWNAWRTVPVPVPEYFSFDCYRGDLFHVSDVGKDNVCPLHGIVGAYFDHLQLPYDTFCMCKPSWDPYLGGVRMTIPERWTPANPYYDPGPDIGGGSPSLVYHNSPPYPFELLPRGPSQPIAQTWKRDFYLEGVKPTLDEPSVYPSIA